MAGGGGWGDPLTRDPTAVLEDVLDGRVSINSAKTEYGVVISEPQNRLDQGATDLLRSTMLQQRESSNS